MITREVDEILETAAELCEQHGLHKGDYWPGYDDYQDYAHGDPCCLVGHLLVATGRTVSAGYGKIRALDEVIRPVRLLLDDRGHHSIPCWADDPDRTAAQVAAALREAATAWRARQTGGA